MGVSGCGKSTVGSALSGMLGWPFRDADEFHPAANIAKMRRGQPLTDADRWPWLEAMARFIDHELEAGRVAILSCSALKRAYRRCIIGAREAVRLVYLKGDQELIFARLKARTGHFMPPSLLDSQFAALQEPSPAEHALVVPITLSPEAAAGRIIAELGLAARQR